LFAPIPLGPQFSQTEGYQKLLAHAAIDAGADIVYGHGSHVLQGVETYKGKPVMYCLGNFATDWIRMRPNKEGMVARVMIQGKRVGYVSLVPVTREADHNNVMMLDPSSGEGARLFQKIKDLSGDTGLTIRGREIVVDGLTPPNHHQ
jgi:poly-gamma-glutamate synthesis protein (capsule biosynthesis protein)